MLLNTGISEHTTGNLAAAASMKANGYPSVWLHKAYTSKYFIYRPPSFLFPSHKHRPSTPFCRACCCNSLRCGPSPTSISAYRGSFFKASINCAYPFFGYISHSSDYPILLLQVHYGLPVAVFYISIAINVTSIVNNLDIAQATFLIVCLMILAESYQTSNRRRKSSQV